MFKRRMKNLSKPNKKSWQHHKELLGSSALKEALDNLKVDLSQQEEQSVYQWEDHPWKRGYRAGQLQLLKKWIKDIESLEDLIVNQKNKRNIKDILVKMKEQMVRETP